MSTILRILRRPP